MKDIPDKSIDMILCDLPYGTTNCKWDSIIPFEPLWNHYRRVIKKTGAIVLFATQPFTTSLICSNLKDYKYNWYWFKDYNAGYQYSKYQPMRRIEEICVFYKKHGTYNPQGLVKLDRPLKKNVSFKKDSIVRGDDIKKTISIKYKNYPYNVLCFKKEFGYHPTQKPVALLEYLIKTYTNEGETVLDNCMGSGSTGVACVNTKRKFIGIEKDEEYFKIAEERINASVFNLPKEVKNG